MPKQALGENKAAAEKLGFKGFAYASQAVCHGNSSAVNYPGAALIKVLRDIVGAGQVAEGQPSAARVRGPGTEPSPIGSAVDRRYRANAQPLVEVRKASSAV